MRLVSGIVLFLASVSVAAAQPLTDAVKVVKNASQPSLAIDREGNPVIVFVHEGNVAVALSPDQGKTFTDPVIAIRADGKARAGHQRGPRIAVDRSRRLYVTAPLPLNKKGPNRAIFYNDFFLAVSTDKGASFSEPVMINDRMSTATRSLHAIAVSGSGDLHVAWLDNRRNKGESLLTAKMKYSAKKPPKSALIADDVCESCAPGLALDPRGNAVLVYREGGKTKKDRMTFIGTTARQARRRLFQKKEDQVPTGFHKITDVPSGVSVCPMDAPAVAVSGDGKNVAVAWMDERDRTSGRNVYWTVGKLGKFPEEEFTHDDRRNDQGHPTLAFDDGGNAWCAWEDGRGQFQQVYAVRSDVRKNFLVSAGEESGCGFPSLASGGGFVGIAYEAGGDIHFRILAAPK